MVDRNAGAVVDDEVVEDDGVGVEVVGDGGGDEDGVVGDAVDGVVDGVVDDGVDGAERRTVVALLKNKIIHFKIRFLRKDINNLAFPLFS